MCKLLSGKWLTYPCFLDSFQYRKYTIHNGHFYFRTGPSAYMFTQIQTNILWHVTYTAVPERGIFSHAGSVYLEGMRTSNIGLNLRPRNVSILPFILRHDMLQTAEINMPHVSTNKHLVFLLVNMSFFLNSPCWSQRAPSASVFVLELFSVGVS